MPSRSFDRGGEQRRPLHDVHQPEADDRGAAGHQHAGRDRRRRVRDPPSRTPPAGPAAPAPPGSGRTPARRSSPGRCRRGCRRWPRAARAVRSLGPWSRRRRRRRARASARRLASLDAVAMTRPAPHRLASWIAIVPDPARAGVHDDRLALGQVRTGAQQVPRRRALDEGGEGGGVGDLVGNREQRRGSAATCCAYPPPPSRPSSRRPSAAANDHLAAGNHGQRLLGEVGVLGLVGVGVVDARGEYVEDLLPSTGTGSGSSRTMRVSGPPNSVSWIARMPRPYPR